jgi:UDP-N-acetylmuramate dehydrogenase
MQFLENFDLSSYNTFGIQASARYFAKISSVAELTNLSVDHKLPLMILGGGSNTLFTRDFDGYILHNEIKGIEKTSEDEDHVYLRVGAGENWHGFVEYCISHGYAGIENLALIPGFTGASPMQNIGAYGVEIRDVFHRLEAFHLHDKQMVSFSGIDCEFGYRESVFKRRFKGLFAITQVEFRLNKKPVFNTRYGAIEQELEKMQVKELSIRAIADAVINIRRSKLPDPAVIGNAGSFFKNPEIPVEKFEMLKSKFPGIIGYPVDNSRIKLAAGWLIEHAGWKGYREGNAGVHHKQALVLVNYGGAKGSDIYALSSKIIDSIRDRYNVELEREVNIV